MRNRRLLQITGAVLALMAGPLRAEVTIQGFGQVVGGSTLDEPTVPGLQYDDHVSFAPESLFALQLSSPLSSEVEAIAQIIGRGRDDYEPEFAWAYLRYKPAADWTLQAGRQRAPFYRYSDYLEVGAAYPFLRPSLAVYRIPYSNYDGLGIVNARSYGDWDLQLQLAGGSARESFVDFGGEIEVEADNLVGVTLDATYGDWLNLRSSYFRARETNRIPAVAPLLAGLRQSGEADVADAIAVEDDPATFIAASAGVDHRNVIAGVEYVYFKIDDSIIGRRHNWYGLLAYRWGKWTPVATYGRSFGGSNPDAIAQMNPASPLAPAVQRLVRGAVSDDRYLSVGARYDLSGNVALKLDYTHYASERPGVESADLIAGGAVFTF